MSYCALHRDENTRLVSSPGGVIRFSTIDSSPQGGWDWVMHGSRTLSLESCAKAFQLAQDLHQAGLSDKQEADIQEELSTLLALCQGVPTAVGSGKSSLRRKVHAVIHSQRLVSGSWREAIALHNSSFSWCGDMGVESGLWLFRQDVRHLFGPWIQAEDDNEVDQDDADMPEIDFNVEPEGAEANANHGEFDFQPEGQQELQEPPGVLGVDAGELDAHLRRNPDNPYMIDSRASIFVAGVLHIIHRITQGLMATLAFTPKFLDWLKNICRLLSHPWSRARFLESCVSHARLSDTRHFLIIFLRVYTKADGAV
jgi:hypothetical protein